MTSTSIDNKIGEETTAHMQISENTENADNIRLTNAAPQMPHVIRKHVPSTESIRLTLWRPKCRISPQTPVGADVAKKFVAKCGTFYATNLNPIASTIYTPFRKALWRPTCRICKPNSGNDRSPDFGLFFEFAATFADISLCGINSAASTKTPFLILPYTILTARRLETVCIRFRDEEIYRNVATKRRKLKLAIFDRKG